MENIKKCGNTIAINNPVEIHKWIKYDEQTECMLLKENAPFLKYRACDKPSIMSVPIPGHDTRNAYVPYGIQGWAIVCLGGKEFIPKTNYRTTCGNPLCMNPDHIVAPETNTVSSPSKSERDKLKDFMQVMKWSSTNMSPAKIADVMCIPVQQVRRYRSKLIKNLLGEGYKWSDLQYAITVAEGIKYADQTPQERITQRLRQKPVEPVLDDLFDERA